MNRKKGTGPNMLPYGTPFDIGGSSDITPQWLIFVRLRSLEWFLTFSRQLTELQPRTFSITLISGPQCQMLYTSQNKGALVHDFQVCSLLHTLTQLM